MHKITLLDGGMGQELLKRSTREVTPMWSADIMMHEPELVSELHLDFIHAGAQVIILNTYTATPPRLAREGQLDKLVLLHNNAKAAAKQAVEKSNAQHVNIAGCLPPLVASYKAEACLSYNESYVIYKELVSLQKEGCDLFICETMSSITEAKAACAAAKLSEKPFWTAFTLADNTEQLLRSGESLEEALQAVLAFKPNAILLNCSQPEAITASWPLLQNIKTTADYEIEIGAYANGFKSVEELYPGDTVAALDARKDLSPDAYVEFAKMWVEWGATIIGGCCEIGPAHIKAMSKALKNN